MYSSSITSFISLGIGVAILGAGIWAAIDAGKYEDWIWERSGQNKVVWILLLTVIPLIACLCCGLLGIIPTLIYFLSIKKKLELIRQGGGFTTYGYGYGMPPGYPPYGGGYPGGSYPGGGYPGGGYPGGGAPGGGYPGGGSPGYPGDPYPPGGYPPYGAPPEQPEPPVWDAPPPGGYPPEPPTSDQPPADGRPPS